MCARITLSVIMFDQDTDLTYDTARGEPRGSRKRTGASSNSQVTVWIAACGKCAQQVDIRDGLQYECIQCALCIDACNSIMDKMNYDHLCAMQQSMSSMEVKRTG